MYLTLQEYENGRPIKLWKTYDENGLLIKETPHEKGAIHGFVKYYQNGQLLKRSSYVYNVKQGTETQYFLSGKRKSETGFFNNIKSGLFYSYNEKGDLLIKGSFKSDLKNGEWTYYDIQGQVLKKEQYAKGRLMSSSEN